MQDLEIFLLQDVMLGFWMHRDTKKVDFTPIKDALDYHTDALHSLSIFYTYTDLYFNE
jgi:hypothetical protein